MLQIVNNLLLIGGGLIALLAILLSLPQSKLSGFLLPIVGWTFALFCGAYIISPVDIIPDVVPVAGWIDDGGALVAGIASAVTAIKAGKSKD